MIPEPETVDHFNNGYALMTVMTFHHTIASPITRRIIRIITSLALLVIGTNYSGSQPVSLDRGVTWDIRNDASRLLPSGEFTVEVLNRSSASRQQEILQKALIALQQNPDILRELRELYELQVDDSERADLFRELGFTREEFEELERILAGPDTAAATTAGAGKVTVKRHVGRIGFEAEGSLRLLNDLVIDPENNVVMLGRNVLSERDTFTVTNPRNPLNSTWRGYRWSYSHRMPKLYEGDSTETLDAEHYRVTLGYRDSDGRTYLEVAVTEIRSGRISVNYVVPMVFR